jgi:MbtH protein
MSKKKSITADSSSMQTEYQEMYFVLINHEEQYSIWPSYKPIPLGWKVMGDERTKEECLAYVEEVWKDMRPLSLRKQVEELSHEK